MSKTIAIVAILDTKGDEVKYLKQIEKRRKNVIKNSLSGEKLNENILKKRKN